MKKTYRIAAVATLAITVTAMPPGRARTAETEGFTVASSQARCTRLTYPTRKDVAEYKKAVAENGGTPPAGFGTRCTRLWGKHPAKVKILPNVAPTVEMFAGLADVTVNRAGTAYCLTRTGGVNLAASAHDPEGDQMLYTWTATGGRVTGDGPNIVWNLDGVAAGTYTITVETDDGCGCVAFNSASVPVK